MRLGGPGQRSFLWDFCPLVSTGVSFVFRPCFLFSSPPGCQGRACFDAPAVAAYLQRKALWLTSTPFSSATTATAPATAPAAASNNNACNSTTTIAAGRYVYICLYPASLGRWLLCLLPLSIVYSQGLSRRAVPDCRHGDGSARSCFPIMGIRLRVRLHQFCLGAMRAGAVNAIAESLSFFSVPAASSFSSPLEFSPLPPSSSPSTTNTLFSNPPNPASWCHGRNRLLPLILEQPLH